MIVRREEGWPDVFIRAQREERALERISKTCPAFTSVNEGATFCWRRWKETWRMAAAGDEICFHPWWTRAVWRGWTWGEKLRKVNFRPFVNAYFSNSLRRAGRKRWGVSFIRKSSPPVLIDFKPMKRELKTGESIIVLQKSRLSIPVSFLEDTDDHGIKKVFIPLPIGQEETNPW